MASKVESLTTEMDRKSERIWEVRQQILDLDNDVDVSEDTKWHRMILLDQYQSVIMSYMETVAEWHEELRDMDQPILWLVVRDAWRDLSSLFSRR